MTSSAWKPYSVDEFLLDEITNELRHEYLNGVTRVRPAEGSNHSLIGVGAASELHRSLKHLEPLVFGSDMMISTPSGLFTYPDASFVCGEPRFEDQKKRVLLNPLLIVEVLSETTEAYDRGKKFDHYRSIESLQEYVLIAQDRAHVDRFTRQPSGEWLLTSYDTLEEAVKLPALECAIPMAEIYRGVEFPPEPPLRHDERPSETQG